MWPGDTFTGSAADLPALDAGIYEITYKLSGLKPENGRAPRLLVYESRLDRVLHEQDVVADEEKPITVTFRTHLPKGRRHQRDERSFRAVEYAAFRSARTGAVRQHQV